MPHLDTRSPQAHPCPGCVEADEAGEKVEGDACIGAHSDCPAPPWLRPGGGMAGLHAGAADGRPRA